MTAALALPPPCATADTPDALSPVVVTVPVEITDTSPPARDRPESAVADVVASKTAIDTSPLSPVAITPAEPVPDTATLQAVAVTSPPAKSR